MSKGGGGSNYYPMPSIQASNSNTNSTQTTSIPQWLTDASQFGVQNAQNIINAGTPQYNQPLTAGLTGTQQAAGNLIQNSIGQSQPYFDGAANAINNSMNTINPSTIAGGLSGIGQYMNPYTSNVIDSLTAQSAQNLDHALTQTGDQAIAAKAFGGSRHGVQEGVATALNNLGLNNQIASLLSSGYNNAVSQLGSDVNTQNAAAQQNASNSLAGGQALSNLGMTNQTANNNNINNLLTFGNLEQMTNQNALSNAYNLWQYQNQYPLQAQQVYNQTVSSAPHNTTTTGSSSGSTTSMGWSPQQQAVSNPLMGGIGGAMAGAQLGNMFPGIGTGVGAIGGGMLGLLGGIK